MKKFLLSLNNRIKAGYLVWVTLHLILYVASGNFLTFDRRFMDEYEAPEYIFPDYPGNRGGLSYYDYSDFLLYLFVPVLIYFIYYYWNKKDMK